MLKISQLFERLRNVYTKEINKKLIVQKIIKNKANIDIAIDDISIKSSEIIIRNISQAAKNEVFIKQILILKEANSKLFGVFSKIRVV